MADDNTVAGLVVALIIGVAGTKAAEKAIELGFGGRRAVEEEARAAGLAEDDTEKKRLHDEIKGLQATIDRLQIEITRKSADEEADEERIRVLEACIGGLKTLGVRHNVELYMLRDDRKKVLQSAENALKSNDPAECCRLLAVICQRLENDIDVPELDA